MPDTTYNYNAEAWIAGFAEPDRHFNRLNNIRNFANTLELFFRDLRNEPTYVGYGMSHDSVNFYSIDSSNPPTPQPFRTDKDTTFGQVLDLLSKAATANLREYEYIKPTERIVAVTAAAGGRSIDIRLTETPEGYSPLRGNDYILHGDITADGTEAQNRLGLRQDSSLSRYYRKEIPGSPYLIAEDGYKYESDIGLVRQGDEYFNRTLDKWQPIPAAMYCNKVHVSQTGLPVRRKVSDPVEYRVLLPEERLEAGDEYYGDLSEWTPIGESSIGDQCITENCHRRPTDPKDYDAVLPPDDVRRTDEVFNEDEGWWELVGSHRSGNPTYGRKYRRRKANPPLFEERPTDHPVRYEFDGKAFVPVEERPTDASTYYMLQPGDETREGDEVYYDNEWQQVSLVGKKIPGTRTGRFRRKANPVPVKDETAGLDPKGEVGATKCPLHLIPPTAMEQAAWAHKDGAVKYGEYNWRETRVEANTYLAAIARHLNAYRDGEDNAEDSGHSHLAHIVASCNILMDAAACGTLVDNRHKRPNR